jgi:hypothetical protein
MLSCVLIGVALAGLGGPAHASPIQAKAKAVANDTKAEKIEHLAALKKELVAKEAELAHVEEEKKELSAKEATLKPKKTPLATELLAGRGVPAKAAANDTKAEKIEHLAALKKELAAKEAELAHVEEEKKELSATEATVAPKNNSFLAGRGGPAKAGANDTKAEKIQHLAALKKELAAKEAELAHVEEEKKELSAKEATLAPKKNATGAVKVAAGASDADRLLAGLDSIRKLKGTFMAEKGEQVGGAMSYELAHGDSIWGAIDSLVSAAAMSRKDKKAAAGSLEKAMAAFTSTVGKKLHEIDTTDKVENEEYVLGLLAHHRHNATEQEWILANFTKVDAVQKLLKNHKKSGEYSEEFAAILDEEHPAAKKITSFLQRVM